MKILLTGGLGFIGSNILKKLNEDENNIVVIFDSVNSKKLPNAAQCEYRDYIDKDFLLHRLSIANWINQFDVILHMGANSSTLCEDKSIIEENYQLTKDLIGVAIDNEIPVIYASSASVYGNTQNENSFGRTNPLNLYAFSKHLTDNSVKIALSKKHRKDSTPMIVGLRFYNVYGPNESHKGRQASVIYNWCEQYKKSKSWNVFEGENKRDFIFVDDIVNVVLWFLKNRKKELSGIYDVGTGVATDFKEISKILKEELPDGTEIVIPKPDDLRAYQTYTRANLDALRSVGYTDPFIDVRTGIKKYLTYLISKKD